MTLTDSVDLVMREWYAAHPHAQRLRVPHALRLAMPVMPSPAPVSQVPSIPLSPAAEYHAGLAWQA